MLARVAPGITVAWGMAGRRGRSPPPNRPLLPALRSHPRWCFPPHCAACPRRRVSSNPPGAFGGPPNCWSSCACRGVGGRVCARGCPPILPLSPERSRVLWPPPRPQATGGGAWVRCLWACLPSALRDRTRCTTRCALLRVRALPSGHVFVAGGRGSLYRVRTADRRRFPLKPTAFLPSSRVPLSTA